MSEQAKRNNITPILLIAVVILVSAIIWAARKPNRAAENMPRPHETPVDHPQVRQHNQDIHAENPTDTTVDTDSGTKSKLSMETVIRNAYGWEPTHPRWYGKQAPNFTLTDINGKTHKLSDYRGKNVIVVFFATWCGPCMMEVPHLIALRNVIGEDKLAILAISDENHNLVKKIVKKKKINYTVFSGDSGQIPDPYNTINSLPSSFFIDSDGKIKLVTTGMTHLGEIKAILRAEWQ